MNEYEKFFLKFPYIVSKTTLRLYLYKLYKFMKICYNNFQHHLYFIKLSNTSTILGKANIKFE